MDAWLLDTKPKGIEELSASTTNSNDLVSHRYWKEASYYAVCKEYNVEPGKKGEGDQHALDTLLAMERMGWLKKDRQEHPPPKLATRV